MAVGAASPAGGKVLVTGAASGIGRAIMATLAAAGWKVVGTDLAWPDEVVAPAVAKLEADLRDPAANARVVEGAAGRLGGLTALVHAAGVSGEGALAKLQWPQWEEALSVNLTSAFHLSRAVLPMLRHSGGGSMVMISALGGERGMAGYSAYAASKAGLHGFCKSLARELGPTNIRVNVVAPGLIQTPTTAKLPDSVREAAVAESCLGRLGDPEDVAGAVSFLLSPAARHITGQVLRVDGGQHL